MSFTFLAGIDRIGVRTRNDLSDFASDLIPMWIQKIFVNWRFHVLAEHSGALSTLARGRHQCFTATRSSLYVVRTLVFDVLTSVSETIRKPPLVKA